MKIRLLGTALIAVAVFGVSLGYHLLGHDDPVSAVQASAGAIAPAETAGPAEPVGLGVPVRVKIPAIRVNAAIERVGLATDGSMGIPKKPLNVAWYSLGHRPGETGSAVISGHINWYYGAIGAFANLRKLKPGDKITVQDDRGAVIPFVVRESRKYDAAADATDIFVSTDGKAHLNLITCAGVWDRRAKQYTQRLVVFADRVAE